MTSATTEAATGSSTTDDMSTTAMTSVDSSTGGGEESSSGGGGGQTCEECQMPREIPAPPVDCTGVDGVLDGSVIIDETPGSDDPAMLEGIAEVTGAIRISSTDLTNLDFMGCVRTVGADIRIFDNDMLTNVDGLYHVESIGTEVIFSNNDALVDFNSLPNIQQMATTLAFRENEALETISGLHSFVGISAEVINPRGMRDITGNITIQQNPSLQNIDGLCGLRVVGGTFAVTGNSNLCMSSVNCVGSGITMPAVPPPEWSTTGNDNGC